MSAFYDSAPVAFALGLALAIARYVLIAIRKTQADFRPVSTAAGGLLRRGFAYGSVLWLVLGASAMTAAHFRGPSGNFPEGGLQEGVFSTAPGPKTNAFPR